ncbi:MAG: FAD-dependent oxidoreductase [Actinomycetota bacterium]
MTTNQPNVAILGAGVAGLTTAWRLTDPDVRDRVGQVTVYQRGHRLGGKAASHRGVHGRIEEHGLHVWLGYYDNAFRLIRECYEELDRSPETHPMATWRDAFAPAPLIGLEDLFDGDWSTWTAAFPPNDRLPGQPIGSEPPVVLADFVRRSIGLMRTFVTSLGGVEPDLAGSVALAAAGEASRAAGWLGRLLPAFDGVRLLLDDARDSMLEGVQANERSRRLWHLLDLVSAQLRGLIADDILRKGFRSIDHLEYRDWIRRHGASEETMSGALVRGLYDLAFSHRGGDPSATAFPAGLGLFLATKTFFDYRGALFWKMQAGMGDVVIAPLYEALRARGVRFEFFHRVDEVIPSATGDAIAEVRLGRQVDLADGVDEYEPLADFDGIACFPEHPIAEQLDADGEELASAHLESYWSRWPDAAQVSLRPGTDFDELVFAIPVGMGRHVASGLAEASPRWASMFDRLETVGTQAFQLWLDPSEPELGWERTGSTVTSFVSTYDTWSSMTHLLDVERWEVEVPPQTCAYFCSSMPHLGADDPNDVDEPREAHDRARAAAIEYLETAVGHYWPNAVDGDGAFRWDLLSVRGDATGPSAIDTQFVTANVDPSDRYVQALPGTDDARLRPGDSGFDHLHLAGDWTDCGLNAGCIEAAVLSGIGAANSILGLPRDARISGGYLFE